MNLKRSVTKSKQHLNYSLFLDMIRFNFSKKNYWCLREPGILKGIGKGAELGAGKGQSHSRLKTM